MDCIFGGLEPKFLDFFSPNFHFVKRIEETAGELVKLSSYNGGRRSRIPAFVLFNFSIHM